MLQMQLDRFPVIGEGRASVVYDLGDGTVLRRYRRSTVSAEPEAELMRLAAAAGVPVPTVHGATGPDLRMERVPGPTMLSDLAEHPRRAESHGRELAALHRRLDAVEPSRGPGIGLLHGDLHPDNVVLGPAGPVLVDWTNSGFGPRALDLAVTWLLLACFDPADEQQSLVDALRPPLLNAFLGAIDRSAATAFLDAAAEIRHADPGTTPAEHVRIEELCRQNRPAR